MPQYNAVLRGLNSEAPFLQGKLISLCCDAETATQFEAETIDFTQAKTKVNQYTTTLHVINSGIVKT